MKEELIHTILVVIHPYIKELLPCNIVVSERFDQVSALYEIKAITESSHSVRLTVNRDFEVASDYSSTGSTTGRMKSLSPEIVSGHYEKLEETLRKVEEMSDGDIDLHAQSLKALGWKGF